MVLKDYYKDKRIREKRVDKNNKSKIFKLDRETRNLVVLFEETRDTLIRAVELELDQSNINLAQCRFLNVLVHEKDGLTQGELSKLLLRNQNTISTLTNKMVKGGLVKKIKNNRDGKIYVALTEKGLEACGMVSERAPYLIFSALSGEEKVQLNNLLRKLRSSARDLLGLDFKPPFLP